MSNVNWNNVVSAVATEEGLLVTERGADGTVGAAPRLMPYQSSPDRQKPTCKYTVKAGDDFGLMFVAYIVEGSPSATVTELNDFLVAAKKVLVLNGAKSLEDLWIPGKVVTLPFEFCARLKLSYRARRDSSGYEMS